MTAIMLMLALFWVILAGAVFIAVLIEVFLFLGSD